MFHDGTALDAEAVKFNFDRMLNEDHPFHTTGPFPLSFFFGSITTTQATDPKTVVFTLSEPFAPFISNLATPTGYIVSPAAVAQHGVDFGRNPSGTGPFKFAEWKSNALVAVEKNADYWDGAPALDAVIFRPITDANTRTAEMLAGGLDLMVEVPPVSLSEFRNDNFQIVEAAGPHLWFLILNCKSGPFADKRVRQAANYAVNKEALVNDVLEGTAAVAAGPTPRRFPGPIMTPCNPMPTIPTRPAPCWQRLAYPTQRSPSL
jgi:peptide/nickel transport system substrate-binding protein